MMKRYIFSIVSILTFFISNAQIEWIDTTYNFGTIQEELGKQYGKIRFVNKSSESTIINKVKTTCGCTVADYPKDEILPGDTAIINFSFNPEGRLGKFEKAIKIYYGVNNELQIIKIKGRIIGKSSTLKNQYPIDEGALRLTANSIIVGDVVKGSSRHNFIHAYNQSNDTIFVSLKNVPEAVSAGISDKMIVPGDIMTISMYYNSIKEDNLGLNIYRFEIVASQKGVEQQIPIELTANIKEKTKQLTPEEMKNAPMIFVNSNIIDLGNITREDKVINASIQLRNEGESELIIKRIYSVDKSITIKRMPTKLSAGDKNNVDIEINTLLIPDGTFNIRLEIISNDPLHQTSMVRIVGQIK